VKAGSFSAGTLSSAIVWKDGMIAAGEQGVSPIRLK
jgi:hypothetical protein